MKDKILAEANKLYVKNNGELPYTDCLRRIINELIDWAEITKLFIMYGISVEDYIDYLDKEAHK